MITRRGLMAAVAGAYAAVCAGAKPLGLAARETAIDVPGSSPEAPARITDTELEDGLVQYDWIKYKHGRWWIFRDGEVYAYSYDQCNWTMLSDV